MSGILSLDVGHLISESDGPNFVTNGEFDSFEKNYGWIFDKFRKSLKDGKSPISLSFESRKYLDDMKKVAGELAEKYENVLLIGIGGSTLGFRTILQSIKGPYYNIEGYDRRFPRVFVLDNADPVLARQLDDTIDIGKTALVYVSKSGATPESAANFVYFYNRYKEAGGDLRDITIICDKRDNGINHIAESIGCNIFYIPEKLPGRYSVLSPVGLFPAELIGESGAELLAGASEVNDSLIDQPLGENAGFILGSCIWELIKKGKLIHTIFNYSNVLSEFGLWFVQLWAESIGKRHDVDGREIFAGSTPLAAIGATDQHSLLQLFKEGPNDKIFGFVTVDEFDHDVTMGDAFPDLGEYAYFSGHKLSEQLKIEQVSTELSLFNADRPCYRIILPEISARTLGGLFYLMEALVVYVANLWNVNPFNQPGVEEGKNMTYSLMGRDKFISERSKHEASLAAYKKKCRYLQL